LAMGQVFGVTALTGCGSARERAEAALAKGQLPEKIVTELEGCLRRGPSPERGEYTARYDVFVTPEGEVEVVALHHSTLGSENVEACMENALRRLSPDRMAMLLEELAPRASMAPPSSARGAQPCNVFALGGVAGALIVVGLVAVTVIVAFHVTRETIRNQTRHAEPKSGGAAWADPAPPDAAPEPAGGQKTKDPPPPPPPPPPPDPPRERCVDIHPDIIRCDDPAISSYNFNSEDAAYRSIKGKGLRKEKADARATNGPCKGRGGFHTNVKQGKNFIASIIGCNCCDDASGKVIKGQRAAISVHY